MQTGIEAAEVIRPDGRAPVVLVCEHASAVIPAEYGDLGLTGAALTSHVAWDIGARDVAVALSDLLDAPLVAARVSRLVYDLNRPLSSPSAMPARSEVFDIPGNADLSEAERAARHAAYHDPFHAAVAQAVTTQQARVGGPVALITVHSFTPVFNSVPRAVELGFLYHSQGHLAEAALAVEQAKGRFNSALNAPYSSMDGVTYTLEKQGEARGLPSLMIEVRNDLIDTPDTAQDIARHLADTLSAALSPAPKGKEAAG